MFLPLTEWFTFKSVTQQDTISTPPAIVFHDCTLTQRLYQFRPGTKFSFIKMNVCGVVLFALSADKTYVYSGNFHLSVEENFIYETLFGPTGLADIEVTPGNVQVTSSGFTIQKCAAHAHTHLAAEGEILENVSVDLVGRQLSIGEISYSLFLSFTLDGSSISTCYLISAYRRGDIEEPEYHQLLDKRKQLAGDVHGPCSYAYEKDEDGCARLTVLD